MRQPDRAGAAPRVSPPGLAAFPPRLAVHLLPARRRDTFRKTLDRLFGTLFFDPRPLTGSERGKEDGLPRALTGNWV